MTECAECKRLAVNFQSAKGLYEEAIRLMLRNAGNSGATEFIRFRKAAHTTRIDWENVSREFEQHKRKHIIGDSVSPAVG